MTTALTTEIVEPAILSATARAALVDALHAVHERIFDGVDRASFRAYVVEPEAEQTRIALFRDQAGELAGYTAIHAYVRTHDGEEVVILRAEAGMLPQWRGQSVAAVFAAQELIRQRLRHWRRKAWYLGAFVHPSAYSATLKRVPTLRPSPQQPYTADELAFVDGLAQQFAMPALDDKPAHVREVGWITRRAGVPHRALTGAAARFYAEQNPWYEQGYGMLVLIPADLTSFVRGVSGVVSYQARSTWQRATRRLTAQLARVTTRVAALTERRVGDLTRQDLKA